MQAALTHWQNYRGALAGLHLDLWRRIASRYLGSTGCQPVLFGSLPKSFSVARTQRLWNTLVVVGKLPTTAG
jgi:hypothetical protein